MRCVPAIAQDLVPNCEPILDHESHPLVRHDVFTIELNLLYVRRLVNVAIANLF